MILCAVALAACGQRGSGPVPSFTLQLANGEQVSLQTLAGKTVVLSFWATWCAPCREELPALQSLYTARYADRADVRFFLISEDQGPGAAGKAAAWLDRHGITLLSALDPGGALGRKLKTSAVLPARVVIGPKGAVLLTTWGYSDENSGFPALRSAIAESTGIE